MSPCPFLRLLVEPLDVFVQLPSVDAPHTSAPDLDGRKLPGTDERVHLGDANAQIDGHILIVLMSSALVVAIWGIARDRLVSIVTTALSNVCGSVGC